MGCGSARDAAVPPAAVPQPYERVGGGQGGGNTPFEVAGSKVTPPLPNRDGLSSNASEEAPAAAMLFFCYYVALSRAL